MKNNYNFKNSFGLFLTTLLLIVLSVNVKAQVSAYAFSQSAGAYTPIAGGTIYGNTTSDDQRFVDPALPLGGAGTTGVGLPIGFNFTYNGIVFDRLSINNNGWISLGQSGLTPSVNNASASGYTAISSTSTATPALLRNRIAALSRDLQAQVGSTLRIETIGVTPNMVCVIQWTNYRRFGGAGDNYNFQIRLNETTNIVDVVYGTMVSGGTTTAQVGLGGTLNSDFNNRTTTTNWAATTAGAVNTASCTISATVFPVSGQTFTWTPPLPCAGTPISGTASSSANPVCSGVNFNLILTGYTVGVTGIGIQWQSSPDGITYSNIPGGTTATFAVNQTAATFYQAVVTCTPSGMSATSNALNVTMNSVANCYCTSNPTNAFDEEVFNVTVSTLNNTSTCATTGGPGSILNRYSNYTTLPATPMTQSTNYAFSIQVGTCGGNFPSGTAIFIDYNQDGDFVDAGEQVFSTPTTTNGPHFVTGSFTVPGAAALGNTRMRIINAEGFAGAAITPCLIFGYGETEDYLVDISAAIPCAGTPSPGLTQSTAPSVCSTTSFTLSMSTPPTGLSGITFQWQSSPDGITYSNIGGATNSIYTTTQGAATYYQCVVTCTNSGLSGTSTPLQVTMNSFISCYCGSTATQAFDEEMFNVTVSTLNNTSTCATTGPGPGSVMSLYSNYMTLPATNLVQTNNYPFSVQIGTCGGNFPSGTAIFIDYNQNGSYADPGEQVYTTPATTNGPHFVTGNFTVPGTALLGNTGMRVINAEGFSGAAITPCLVYGYGETEDYMVNIQLPPPIDMMALDLFFPTTADCHSASDSVVITIRNNGSALMDYSVTPVTVYASATGVNPATFGPIVISTGTLASGSTQNVTVVTGYNMSVPGAYVFYASTSVAGDGNTGNDTMSAVTVNVQGINAIVDNDTVCVGDSVNLDIQLPPTMATIGTGTVVNTTTTYPAPYGNWYWGARNQFLITAAELTALGLSAGPIGSAAFDVVTTNSVGLTNFSIAMKLTATASLTVFETGLTSVYSTPSYIPVVGFNTHTFGTAFTWDGTSNIIIETCFNNGSFTQNCVVNQTVTPFTSSIYYRADAAGVCPNPAITGTATQRPNIRLSSVASYTYNWTPAGDMDNASLQNPAAQVPGSTTYTVVVTNTATGCTMTDTVNVFANPLPVFSLNDTTVCAGASYTLNAQNAGSTYLWSTSATTQTIAVSTGGLYYVDITTANGCTARDSINLIMNAQPVVNLGADVSFCAGDSILIDAGNTGFTFLWSTSSTNQTINASTGGAYYVTVTNPATLCAASDTINVTIDPLPVIPLGIDTALCIGDSLILDAGNPGFMFLWNDASTNQTLTVNAVGTYSVMVTNPVTTCYSSDTINISINALPVVSLGADTAICNMSTLTLDAGNPGSTYMWSDASSAQTLGVTMAGNYSVAVTDVNGCSGNDSINVSIDALPVVSIGPDVTQCGGSVLLDAGNVTASYLWSDVTVGQTLTALTTGNYYVAVTDTNGCVASDSAMITINYLPVGNLGADSIQCGGSITMDAGNPGLTYLWSNSTTNQILTVFLSGSYDVTVTDTVTGCNSSDTVNLTINNVPVVDLGADTTQCGGSITLDAGPGAASYLWSSSATTQTLTVSSSGTLDVTVTNGVGCSVSDTIVVTIYSVPIVGFVPPASPVCLQALPIVLSGTPAGGVFTGTGVTGNMFDPSVAGIGTFTLMYSFTDANSCSNNISQNISVQDCTGIEENVFALEFNVYPNPTSGTFNIALSDASIDELTISIINIQGKEVYHELDTNVSADYNKQISLDNLAKGIYYIMLSTDTDRKVKKLIIQ